MTIEIIVLVVCSCIGVPSVLVLVACMLSSRISQKQELLARNRAGGWAEYSPNRNRRIY